MVPKEVSLDSQMPPPLAPVVNFTVWGVVHCPQFSSRLRTSKHAYIKVVPIH